MICTIRQKQCVIHLGFFHTVCSSHLWVEQDCSTLQSYELYVMTSFIYGLNSQDLTENLLYSNIYCSILIIL